jgi:serine/threonine protein kinase
MSLGVSGSTSDNPISSPLKYWESGLFFSDAEVVFRVESLSGSKMQSVTDEHGILIVASPNNLGIKIIGQLIDMALSLLREMYPGLTEISQRIPCYECVRMRREHPYEFNIEQCWLAMEEQRSTIECSYNREDPTKNHTMAISKIAPDLLLQDIDTSFMLNPSEIKREENLPTRSTDYERICKGTCRGSSVTIMYPYKSKEALSKLRSDIQILQKSHHPCLICLIGVVLHPKVAIVIERAPENSLEWPLITRQSPIHRITLFRIAAQVAAALKFLHKNGILFRDLKASNVLMWTLSPDSLCHCKLANSPISTQLYPTGVKGLRDTKGFIAPEVLHMGANAQYNEMADIFSFGMLLYQMISRQHPYHELNEHKTLLHKAVQKGERPKLQKDSCGSMAYHYLSQAMEACWNNDPQRRPSAENLIKYMCLSSTQSVMSVVKTRDGTSMRQAHVVRTQRNNDVWICSNGNDDIEIDVYSLSTMTKTKTHPIKNTDFSSLCLCKDYIWLATRDGISCGTLSIINTTNLRQEHRIPQWDYMVSCISCSDTHVYVGTIDGLCFSFPIDLKGVKNSKPRKKELPENKQINDILFVTHVGYSSLWVSHQRYIYILQPDNLEMEHQQYRGHSDDLVGKLSISPNDSSVVWSAHIGGIMLSAWDVNYRSMKFEVNTTEHMDEICQTADGTRRTITAMTTALDTVWVGMTSGHILVFADQELLTWYHPYTSYVQFITVIPGPGPCKTEECMVLTGGQKFKCLIPENLQECKGTDKHSKQGSAIILWEAFSKKTIKQITFIEAKASESQLFETIKDLRDSIQKEYLGFKDGTHILPEDTFTIQLIGKTEPFDVMCPRPIKRAFLLNKIQKKASAPNMDCKIEYRDGGSGECIEIQSQEDLDNYVKLDDRPQLLCHLIPFSTP